MSATPPAPTNPQYVWKRVQNISDDCGTKKPAAAELRWSSKAVLSPPPPAAPQLDEDDVGSPNSDFDMPNAFVYNVPPSDLGPRYFQDVAQGGQKTLLIIMVGLPARGKTFLAQKLCRLLSWQGYQAQVFNAQLAWKEKLRQLVASSPMMSPTTSSPSTPSIAEITLTRALSMVVSPATPDSMVVASPSASPSRGAINAAEVYRDLCENPDSIARQAYISVLLDLAESAKQFFQHESFFGNVMILNDDFPTKELRDLAEKYVGIHAAKTIFVEVQRSSEENTVFDAMKAKDPSEYLFEGGAAATTSAFPQEPSSPEAVPIVVQAVAIDPEAAVADFSKRVSFIERKYQQMTPESGKSYVKLKNTAVLEIHRVTGFLCSRIVSFLMNLSQLKIQHPIYFVRHGQSMYNLEDRLGGDPELTPKGELDAEALCSFLSVLKDEEKKRGVAHEMQVWTSQLRRAMQTAEPAEKKLGIPCLRWSSLNEIHAGVCENMTYKEVEKVFPLIHRFRTENKYSFRYPEGESYQDLVMRLEPVIMELENANRVVVVVAHQAVLRALLAYFGGTPAESAVYVEVPHRCVWRCTYSTSGTSNLDVLKLGAASAGDGCKD